ncbi:hypothetical protein L2V86_16065 [Escherichia coli]|nr:hypothetical protein [Escherichia coli]MCF4065223.1 hypothetical protein [Escherichia coli]
MGYILIKYNWNVFLFYKQYLGEWILYGNGNFWQLFLGKEPYSKKSDFVKAWLLWWAITILVLFILSLTTTLNLRSIGIGLSFGFCQILGRYTMSLGWSKYWGVLGVLPVTNIVLFLILIFFKKR